MAMSWEQYSDMQERAAWNEFAGKLEAAIREQNEGRNLKRYSQELQAHFHCPHCDAGFIAGKHVKAALPRCDKCSFCGKEYTLIDAEFNRELPSPSHVKLWFNEERVEAGGCWGLCSFGGKDADLDPSGCTGIAKIVGMNDDEVTVEVGGHKTVGSPDDEDKKDVAQEMVCGTSFQGEWTGEDWCLHFREDVTVAYQWNDDLTDEQNFEAIASTVIEAARKACEPFEMEMSELSADMDQLFKDDEEEAE